MSGAIGVPPALPLVLPIEPWTLATSKVRIVLVYGESRAVNQQEKRR